MQATPFSVCAALAVLAASTSAQSNDTPLSNGGEIFVFFSDPSVGTTAGAVGDAYWRAFPGDRLLAHQHGPSGSTTMEINGFYEELYDTDWNTTPHFYDRHVGPALPVIGLACALEPAFLQTGSMSTGATVIVGPSGFGNPCSIAPSLCSPAGGCGLGGVPVGWIVDISFGVTPGTGVVLPADGTSASDMAVAYLLPDGMPATGGPCGLGDYALQASYSTDETQADDCSGQSAFSGFKLGALAATQDPRTETPTFTLGWREPVLNVVADSGTGLGVEQGPNGGGALNGLKLDTQSGAATIGVEVRDFEGVGDLAYAWSTLYADGLPGLPVGSAWLLQRFNRLMPACFLGTIGATPFVFTAEGAFTTCQIPQLPVAGPVDLYWQALMQDPLTGTLRNTNRVRTTLY